MVGWLVGCLLACLVAWLVGWLFSLSFVRARCVMISRWLFFACAVVRVLACFVDLLFCLSGGVCVRACLVSLCSTSPPAETRLTVYRRLSIGAHICMLFLTKKTITSRNNMFSTFLDFLTTQNL